jgi:glycerol-1-phosphate dehydrogenase [NAD(P)+]
MSQPAIHIQLDNDIIPHLIQFCAGQQLSSFLLVADDNTYPILGQAIENALAGQGWDVKTVVLSGNEIIPNEHYLIQVLVQADTQNRTYLAVGSGTLTDIARFASHRTKAAFISVPTAPSVDGYTSIGAPLVIDNLKQTVVCHAPLAVFGNLPTLCAAPKPMIASGFGDILGKYTAVADWQLGHLLWAETYDETLARRTRQAVESCTNHTAEIGQATPAGIRLLLDGLIETGLCMLEYGGSSPASGAEHHISHHLEMKIVWDKLPPVFHGAKVGVATLMVAGYYQQIRQLNQAQAAEKLAAGPLPPRNEEIERIKAVYAPITPQLSKTQAPFLTMTAQDYEALKQKIIKNWPKIQSIAHTVPNSAQLTTWLYEVGAATDMETLGFAQAEVDRAVKNCHYLRNRFTVLKLSRMLGIL